MERTWFAAICALALVASCGNAGGTSSSGAGPLDASALATAPASAAAPPASAEAGAPQVELGAEAGAADTSARPAGKCPEPTNPDRVVAFDWSKELGVDAPLAARLRGVSGTAVEAQLLAAQVDAELRTACGAMAAELGVKGSFASAPVACQAAVDALKAARAKLDKKDKVALHAHPAICPEAIDDVKECAKRCSGQEQAPDATCAGATAGRCPGTCDGPCELRTPGVCEGTCLGQCESGFTGTCDGTCKGKCDGIEVKPTGECKGKCEGACDAVGKGECKGRCAGGCQLHASACAGTCAGRCSVAVQAPQCLGSVKLAATSTECGSYCELRAVHRAACGAAQVDVRVDGPKDAPAGVYAGAIERHLPAVLKVEQQLKGRVELLNRAKGAVASGLKAITASGGAAMPTLSSCLFGYDKVTVEGVTSLLQASRSASEVVAAARAK
jgi:hypothetical protein